MLKKLALFVRKFRTLLSIPSSQKAHFSVGFVKFRRNC